jgi:hypothetical protein
MYRTNSQNARITERSGVLMAESSPFQEDASMEHCACATSAFISCSFSSSLHIVSPRVTPCNSGLPSWVRLSRSSHVTGWAGLDFQRCSSNCKDDDDVLLGKRWTWMQRGKQCCLFLLLVLCLAISARAIPIPQCDPCKPSCRPGGDSDLVAPVCEDLVQEMLIYKGTVVILYSSGVPVMVCLLMAWTFWKAPRD